jgi:hypothetical protein
MVTIAFRNKTQISFYTSHSGKKLEPFTGTDVMPKEKFEFLEISKATSNILYLVCTDGQLASVPLQDVAAVAWS